MQKYAEHDAEKRECKQRWLQEYVELFERDPRGWTLGRKALWPWRDRFGDTLESSHVAGGCGGTYGGSRMVPRLGPAPSFKFLATCAAAVQQQQQQQHEQHAIPGLQSCAMWLQLCMIVPASVTSTRP